MNSKSPHLTVLYPSKYPLTLISKKHTIQSTVHLITTPQRHHVHYPRNIQFHQNSIKATKLNERERDMILKKQNQIPRLTINENAFCGHGGLN